MDSRTWFLLQERPKPAEFDTLLKQHCPHSAYRCPEVMQVFHAGFYYGFRLIDDKGQPTNALKVMVWKMGAELCQANGLAPEEQRHFTHHKGVLDPVFKDRWFIRNISRRCANDLWASEGNSYCGGPYWNMFKTKNHLGLLHKERVTQWIDGEKRRTHLFIAVCPPDWEINDDVYCGLWRWHGYHVRGLAWDSYPYLAELERRWAAASREVTPGDGHAAMVSA